MSITKDKATEIRNDVVRMMRQALGLHEQEAVALADDITVNVVKRMSGVHVPASLIKEYRNQAILRDFTGNNQRALATKYGLSVNMIYKILCKKR